MSTCCICSMAFDARHSYGICKNCFSSDRLREYDRVESAVRQARKAGFTPITLCLPEWLSVLSDFAGVCALCKRYGCSKILMANNEKGLTYNNVVPACHACYHHYINGFDAAKEEIMLYLDQDRQPKFIPQDEDKYKDEVMEHVEYH
jgi:hypothetical protein